MMGGGKGVAKTAKSLQNAPKTAKPSPKSLKTKTAMSVQRGTLLGCMQDIHELCHEQHLKTVN